MAVVDQTPGSREGGDGDLDAAALFAIVWDAIAEVLGTAATAAIVRRAAGRAAPESPELVDVVIRRETLEYRYTLPHAWSHPAGSVGPNLGGTNAMHGAYILDTQSGRVWSVVQENGPKPIGGVE